MCRTRFGHFDVVELDNGVSLDFADAEGAIRPQHYGLRSSKSLILSAVEADFACQHRGVLTEDAPTGPGAQLGNTME